LYRIETVCIYGHSIYSKSGTKRFFVCLEAHNVTGTEVAKDLFFCIVHI